MSDNVTDDTVFVVHLSIRELKMLRRSLARHVAKLESALAKSTFVPEPGRTNVTESSLRNARGLLERLDFHTLPTMDERP